MPDPIKVRGGFLYWDFTVRAVQNPKTKRVRVTVTGNRSGKKYTSVGFPLPALVRAMVKLSNRKGKL